GLAAAIHLARAGIKVRLLERAARVGGKLRQLEVGGQLLDAGPSVLTMPWVFRELVGEGELALKPVEPMCRHVFCDGSVLDLYHAEERSRAAIERLAGAASARGYSQLRRRAAAIYELVRAPFIEQPLPGRLGWLSPQALLKLGRIDAGRTLWKALAHDF